MEQSAPGGTALVTGASSGIGAAFAERLAADGHDLVLVARRRDRLDAAAARLAARYGRRVEVQAADLTAPDGLATVEERISSGEPLALLVNNAGFAGYGPFAEADRATVDGLIGVHVRAIARLSHAALPGMLARGSGAVINVASLLAFSGSVPPNPLPHRATYAGAKAFVVTFTQALAGELAGSGVRALVVCPGVVESEFHGGAPTRLPPMRADDIVAAALAGLAAGEVVCVPGLEDPAAAAAVDAAGRALIAAGNRPTLAPRYRPPQDGPTH